MTQASSSSSSLQPPVPVSEGPPPLSPQEERTWAMLVHLSVLLNLVSGLLGPIAALVVFLVFQKRSRFVALHALQSLWMQLVLWLGGSVLAAVVWLLVSVLSVVLVGLVFLPLACVFSLFPVAAVVYGIIAAVKTAQGEHFRYYLFGDWAERMLS